jgi:hypothetical protein
VLEPSDSAVAAEMTNFASEYRFLGIVRLIYRLARRIAIQERYKLWNNAFR